MQGIFIMNNQEEVWLPIFGYDGLYEISSFGQVKSFYIKQSGRNGFLGNEPYKIISQRERGKGYLGVLLSKNFAGKTYSVHRLVAEAFIPNPENKPMVNHKNGIKTDNSVTNLEWMTNSENIQHAFNNKLIKSNYGSDHHGARPIIQMDILGNEINTFETAVSAEKNTGISKSAICYCLKGKTKTSGGFKWKYKI